MKPIILFLSVLFFCGSAHAQNGFPSLNEISLDLKYCGGAVYKHTKKVNIEPPSYSQEVELSMSHRTFGKRKWERINNCPVPSLNLCYTNYGGGLGQALSFYPGIEWAVLRKKSWSWSAKIGGGIGLATDSWSRKDTMNNYLGSTLNNFTTIQTALNFQLSKKIEIQAGGRMSHISNGAFRIPNFGINLFSSYLGIIYYPIGIQPKNYEKAAKPNKRKINIGTRFGIAWAEHNVPDGALYRTYSQSVFLVTPLLRKHNLYLGADVAYDTRALSGYKYTAQSGNLNTAATNSSIFVGAELLYGRVGIPFQVGVYTKKLRNQDAIWYQKLGFQYYFYRNDKSLVKRVFAGPLLKANKINADYIEFCVGAMF